ncbi:MAG: GGDEF domain-containing protein [Candidatus Woesearchaeota archaeon]
MPNQTLGALDHLVEELSKPEAKEAVQAMQHADQRTKGRRVEDNIAILLNTYFIEFVQKMQLAGIPNEALDTALTDLKKMGFFAPRVYRRNNGYCSLIRELDAPPKPMEEQFSFDSSNLVYRHLFIEKNPFFVSENTLESTLLGGANDPSYRLPLEAKGLISLRYSVPSFILQREIEGAIVVNYNPEHLFANANADSIGWRVLSYVSNTVSMQVAGLLGLKHYERVAAEAQALAREKDNLAKEKEHLAIHDPLTGMLNRYQMLNHLKEIWEAQVQNDICGAEILFDCDRLKAINDAYGHPRGDAVLIEVANKMDQVSQNYFRSRQITADCHRYGGDEFVISIGGRMGQSLEHFTNDISEFSSYLLNVMHDITAVPLEFKPTSASLGVVITQHQKYSNMGETFVSNGGNSVISFTPDEEGWHQRTDLALYKAKEAGRDQARLYLPESTERIIRP